MQHLGFSDGGLCVILFYSIIIFFSKQRNDNYYDVFFLRFFQTSFLVGCFWGLFIFRHDTRSVFFLVGILKTAHANGDPALNQFH